MWEWGCGAQIHYVLLRGVWAGGEGVDDFAGFGVMEFFAGFVLDGVGAGFQAVDLLAELGVFLLDVFDLFLEAAVFRAHLVPYGEAVVAVDDVTHDESSQGYGEDGSGGTPGAAGEGDRLLAQCERGGGRGLLFGLEQVFGHWISDLRLRQNEIFGGGFQGLHVVLVACFGVCADNGLGS